MRVVLASGLRVAEGRIGAGRPEVGSDRVGIGPGLELTEGQTGTEDTAIGVGSRTGLKAGAGAVEAVLGRGGGWFMDDTMRWEGRPFSKWFSRTTNESIDLDMVSMKTSKRLKSIEDELLTYLPGPFLWFSDVRCPGVYLMLL